MSLPRSTCRGDFRGAAQRRCSPVRARARSFSIFEIAQFALGLMRRGWAGPWELAVARGWGSGKATGLRTKGAKESLAADERSI